MISLIFRYLTTIIHDVVVVQHYHPDTWIEKLESGKDLCKGYGAVSVVFCLEKAKFLLF